MLVDDDSLGSHPWDSVPPVVLDTTAALELGYTPVGDYAATVADELDWLVESGADDEYFAPFLDYDAEDRYLAARG